MAGKFVTSAARRGKGEILPVDSEHSAVFQAIAGRRREVLYQAAVDAVGHAGLEVFQRVVDVQVGQDQRVEGVDQAGVAQGHQVEVAATAWPAGGDAVLAAGDAHQVVEGRLRVGVELGREGAVAHPRRISLEDAQHLVQAARADAALGRGAGGAGHARRHEGIGAGVDVQQRALGALEQGIGIAVAGQVVGQVERHRFQLGQPVGDVGPVGVGQVAEAIRVVQVSQADAVARGLHGIGDADAAAGGADRLLAPGFHFLVDGAVARQDDVRPVADEDPAMPVDAALGQHVQLGEQRLGVDDHAGAQDDGLVRVEHAGRDQVQGELLIIAHDGVSSVGAAGETDYHLGLAGQVVDHLALALIAPLGADNYQIHAVSCSGRATRRPLVPPATAGAPATAGGCWDGPGCPPANRRAARNGSGPGVVRRLLGY